MNIERIREVARVRPFQPFWLCLKDGRSVEVRHEDLIGLAPWGTSVTVYDASDGNMHSIQVSSVVRIEKAPGYEFDRNIIAIREALNAPTFRPFAIRLADGRTFKVPAPQYVSVSPGSRKVVHFSPEDDTMTVLDPPFIRDLELIPATAETLGTGS